ncbi:MAG: hypothetical protein JRN52_02615 [Nitrososphaerota archaeon]|nr:hypothetical protein [Nitrososphaerota archaeon]
MKPTISPPDEKRVLKARRKGFAKPGLGLRHSVVSSKLEFTLEGSPEELRAIKSALLPETKAGKRTLMNIRLMNGEKKLVITISAPDLVSMRASLNSNLRLVASALKTIESVA